jgi:hypothetical protein
MKSGEPHLDDALAAIRDLGKTWVLRDLGRLGEWELAGNINVRRQRLTYRQVIRSLRA